MTCFDSGTPNYSTSGWYGRGVREGGQRLWDTTNTAIELEEMRCLKVGLFPTRNQGTDRKKDQNTDTVNKQVETRRIVRCARVGVVNYLVAL